jgi:hypothetical protein
MEDQFAKVPISNFFKNYNQKGVAEKLLQLNIPILIRPTFF